MKSKILNAKAEEIGERTVRFRISSEVVDRDGDILIADGCDFGNFMKNPVFLPFHKADSFPLGKVVSVFVENNAVYADVYFPTVEEMATNPGDASEKAKLVDFTYHCYKNGMLNAVSVGFIAKETENILDGEGYITGHKFLQWELLEFSAVAVPANQDAVAQAVKSFGSEKAKDLMPVTKQGDGQTENVKSLIKACNDRIKACEDEIKALESDMKECLEGIRVILKEIKGEEIEIEEDSEGENEGDESVLEVES